MKSYQADLMLLMVTIFWGTSCLLTKIGLGGIEEFNLIALRFVIAFTLAAVVFRKKIMTADKKTIKYGAILSVIIFAEYIFMTFGVKFTTVSNAGFLTCLAGVFVPIITFVFLKQKLERKVLICICLTGIGIFLLTVNAKLTFNFGDLLCTLCSLTFAVHILAIGKFTREVDSISLGVIQLGFAGVYSTIFSFLFEHPVLPGTVRTWLVVLSLSILCTAVAFIVQTVAQKYTSPVHTGLIFSLEPVFTAVTAFLFANEVLPVKGYFGGLLMVISILYVEVDLSALRRKKISETK